MCIRRFPLAGAARAWYNGGVAGAAVVVTTTVLGDEATRFWRCPVFEKFASGPARGNKAALELTETIRFVTALVENGFRISYGALALTARHYKEDSSGQIPAQRGATLVKILPVELQPFVCRKDGGYALGVLQGFENVPSDMKARPVITDGNVDEALEEWDLEQAGDDDEMITE